MGERYIWGDLPADPRALRLSIAELERAEGLCLHEIENEVSYLESVDLVLHEVKRLRWRPIETAPKERDAAGRLQQALLIGRYPSNGYYTDIVQGWWCDGPPGEEGGWERWRHAFPPSHWMPVPAPPAQCDGSGEAGETAGLAPKDDSTARAAGAPDRASTPAPSQQRGERS